MKRTLFFALLSAVLGTPGAFAKTELEILRAKCKEQEAQIQMLEDENSRLGGAAESRVKSAPASQTQASAPKAEERAATAVPTSSSSYTVKAGDNFSKIARKTGTSPEKLAKANGLKLNSTIRVGQTLKVPGKPAASSTSVAANTPAAPAAANSMAGKTHTVRQGETYSTISRKYKVSTASLIAANPKVKATAMRPGQVINLGPAAQAQAPVPAAMAKTPAAAPVPAPVPAPITKAPVTRSASSSQTMPVSMPMPKHAAAKTENSPAPSPAPSTPPATAASEVPPPHESSTPSPEKKIQPVVIETEMTYGDFAAKHGTNAERLNALNGLDLTTATVLAKGSELYVPAQP